MKNPFKKIGYPKKEAPKEMKKQVMESVNSFKLLLDMMSLFSLYYVKSVETLFNKKK